MSRKGSGALAVLNLHSKVIYSDVVKHFIALIERCREERPTKESTPGSGESPEAFNEIVTGFRILDVPENRQKCADFLLQRLIGSSLCPFITGSELADIFISHLAGVSTEVSPAVVERLAAHLLASIVVVDGEFKENEGARFPIRSVRSDCNELLWAFGSIDFVYKFNYAWGEYGPVDIWTSSTGISVSLWLEMEHPGEIDEPFGRVSAQVRGIATQAAIKKFQGKVTQILQSLINSACYVNDWDFAEKTPFWLPPFGPITYGNGMRLIETCLDSHFEARSRNKKDFWNRIRNAVSLLESADAATAPSVKIALSVSAIEALVCGESSAIAEEFATRVSALLERDRKEWPRWRKALKKLYNIRSKVLHGENLGGTEEIAVRSRKLAAGVLYATCLWKSFKERAGEELDFGEFLKESDARDVNEVVGIDEDLSHCLFEVH